MIEVVKPVQEIRDVSHVVEMVESLLERVKSGQISAVSYAETRFNGDGATGHAVVAGACVVTHLGNIEIMKARFMHSYVEV